MKYFFYIITFSLINSIDAQIEIPYLQDFENLSFHENKNIALEVNGPVKGKEAIIDISKGNGYTWELSNAYQTMGKSLRMTVHEHDHTQQATHDTQRSRSEVVFNMQNINQKTLYYSWKMFIPDDNEFKDDAPESNYHKFFQILASTWDQANNKRYDITAPVVAGLEYRHDTSSPNNKRDLYYLAHSPKEYQKFIEIKRDKEALINSTNDPSLVIALENEIAFAENEYKKTWKRLTIKDGVEKGAWNHFTLEINWSKNEDAYIKFWINRKPVVVDSSLSPNPNIWNRYYANISNDTTQTASAIHTANVVYTNDSNIAVPNNIKLGNYRRYHTKTHSLYFDNFSVTKDFPPTAIKTRLTHDYCGITLPIEDLKIRCYKVPNGKKYKFRFREKSDLSNSIPSYQWVDSYTPMLDLYKLDFIEPNTTYEVHVRELNYEYGEFCTITTPYQTKLIEGNCNLLLENMQISCYPVPNATTYKFRLKELNGLDTSNPAYFWIDSATPTINLLHYPNIKFNTQYEVDVRDLRFDYGASCVIKTPKLQGFYASKRETSNNDEEKKNMPKVYPNPFETFITIDQNQNIERYRIINVQGKIMDKDLKVKNGTINLSKLRKGLYILELISDKELYQYKIVKD